MAEKWPKNLIKGYLLPVYFMIFTRLCVIYGAIYTLYVVADDDVLCSASF